MCIRDRCQGVEQGSCGGEPCRGGCGVVSVLGQQRRDFAYDVADGASADLEQIGEGVLGAEAALVEDGAQHAPVRVRVEAIVATTTSWLVNGRPRQFMAIWENSRCSILFHLLVPGGKWQTVIIRPVSVANTASSAFHSR